jgi:hypothetical protein
VLKPGEEARAGLNIKRNCPKAAIYSKPENEPVNKK